MNKNYIQYIAELKNIYGEELVQNALSEMIAKHDANWDLFISGEFDVLNLYLP